MMQTVTCNGWGEKFFHTSKSSSSVNKVSEKTLSAISIPLSRNNAPT